MGESIIVTVDLEQPIPKEFAGKVGFNMELFPGWLFGKTWIMGNKSGIFPRQANGSALTDTKHLAAAARVLKGFNDDLAEKCLEIAETLFSADYQVSDRIISARLHTAIELFLTTSDERYEKIHS